MGDRRSSRERDCAGAKRHGRGERARRKVVEKMLGRAERAVKDQRDFKFRSLNIHLAGLSRYSGPTRALCARIYARSRRPDTP